jgi:hypothetical protein
VGTARPLPSNTAHPAANRACVNFICLHYVPWSRPCVAALANDVNWLRERTEAAKRSPASLYANRRTAIWQAGAEATSLRDRKEVPLLAAVILLPAPMDLGRDRSRAARRPSPTAQSTPTGAAGRARKRD